MNACIYVRVYVPMYIYVCMSKACLQLLKTSPLVFLKRFESRFAWFLYFHRTALQSPQRIIVQCSAVQCSAVQCTALHCTALHRTALLAA